MSSYFSNRKKLLPTQVDFSRVVSGSAAGLGSFIALDTSGKLVLGSPANFLSGSTGTIHNLSASTITSNLLDSDRVTIRQLGVSGSITFSGLASGTPVASKYLALDSNNNIVLTTAGGASLAYDSISGSLATYHRFLAPQEHLIF